MARYKLLFADPSGKVLEHPRLWAAARSGEELFLPGERPIPLPSAGKLVQLPGRLPVGIDPDTGELELVREIRAGRRTFAPAAVGAVLPPGYTRTLLPGEVKAEGPVLPQWAYTAAAWGREGAVAWAIHTDRRTHWDPSRFSTPELRGRIAAHLRRMRGNPVAEHLRECALVYRCFTAQNVFYERDEGGIPASVACNARCAGCLSEQPEDGPPASHARICEPPSGEAMGQVGAHHLANASGRRMVSFGQGCEGEPLTRWRAIAEAIRSMRARTGEGSINVNTNASHPAALAALYDAGLDAVRISLNSAAEDLYEAYYRPVGYGWEQVEASIALSRERGAYVALNLLTFPGVTDRAGEVRALARLVRRYRVDQVQARSLCIDPLQYLEIARGKGAGGEPIGIRRMLRELRRAAPWLSIGNFARAKDERPRQHHRERDAGREISTRAAPARSTSR